MIFHSCYAILSYRGPQDELGPSFFLYKNELLGVMKLNQNTWKKSRDGTATQTLDTTHVHCPIGHPVDLDVVYDAIRTCNLMLYGEIKYKIAGLSTGQRILLENLVKNSSCGAIGFFATHDVYDTDAEIDLARCHIEKLIANFPIATNAPIYTWLDYRKQNLTVSDLFDYIFENRGGIKK